MPPPPPAEGLASRLFLGPALRTQPDRRLVSLVREGYEIAFEEIVRRYNRTLGRYAAAIVPKHRAEDVTQDAFSKALLALRQSDSEIELRPWLFRIVRNTALNDIRDQPPAAQPLVESTDTTGSALEETLRREEIADLMRRLRALPNPQRTAIVMRELEGLSHEEIAAALGITGGAARQAIYRARRALRDGVGMLIPLPALKLLLGGGVAAPAGAAGIGIGGAAGGAGVGLKAAAATLLVAGTVGTGIAIHERGNAGEGPERARLPASGSALRGAGGSQYIPAGNDLASGARAGTNHAADGSTRHRSRGGAQDPGARGQGGHPRGSSGQQPRGSGSPGRSTANANSHGANPNANASASLKATSQGQLGSSGTFSGDPAGSRCCGSRPSNGSSPQSNGLDIGTGGLGIGHGDGPAGLD